MPDELIHLLGQNDLVLLGFAAALGAMVAVAASACSIAASVRGARADLWLIAGRAVDGLRHLGHPFHRPCWPSSRPGASGYAVCPSAARCSSRSCSRVVPSGSPPCKAAGACGVAAARCWGSAWRWRAFRAACVASTWPAVDWAVVPLAARCWPRAAAIAPGRSGVRPVGLPGPGRRSAPRCWALHPRCIHVHRDSGASRSCRIRTVAMPPGRLRAGTIGRARCDGRPCGSLAASVALRRARRALPQPAANARSGLHGLADAAVEGLLICDGDAIVTVNTSFAALTGLRAVRDGRHSARRLLPASDARARRLAAHRDASRRDRMLLARRRADPGRDASSMRSISPASRTTPSRCATCAPASAPRQRILFLAHHDALTGLANRSSFHARLDDRDRGRPARRRRASRCSASTSTASRRSTTSSATRPATTCCRRVAMRVWRAARRRQLMARLGGDEFAILCPTSRARRAAGRLAETILEALAAAMPTAAGPLIATSIGIALYPGRRDGSRRRSSATPTRPCTGPRAEGRGTCRFFEASMGAQVRDRRMLEHDLRQAVARGELELVYQPQIPVETGEVIGFEALLRWRHPERGAISPARVHPHRRGERRHPADRRMGAARGLPRGRGLAAPLRDRRQRLGGAAPQPGLRRSCVARHPVRDRPRSAAAGTRDHRDGADPRSRPGAARPCASSRPSASRSPWTISAPAIRRCRTCAPSRSTASRSTARSSSRSTERAGGRHRARRARPRARPRLPVLAEGVETAGELGFLGAELCHEAQGYLSGPGADRAASTSWPGLPRCPNRRRPEGRRYRRTIAGRGARADKELPSARCRRPACGIDVS